MLFCVRKTPYYTLEEALKGEIIPKSYRKEFEKVQVCEYCGAHIVINENLTEMKCANPQCPMTLTARALGVYRRYDAKGVGPALVSKYLRDNNIKNMYEALVRPPQLVQKPIQEWFDTPHSIGEVIKMLNLPGQGDTVTGFFTNVSDSKRFIHDVYSLAIGQELRVNELYLDASKVRKVTDLYFTLDFEVFKEKFLKYGVDLECETKEELDFVLFKNGLYWYMTKGLGGSRAETARVLAETLAYYRDEFIFLLSRVKIDKPIAETCKIVITGDIINVVKDDGTYYDRDEFVAYLNKFTRPRGVLLLNSTALKSCDYVIADTPSNTNKYRAGKAENKLITSDVFLALVKSGTYPPIK